MADLNGQLIDQRYEVLELLDEGGMAMVYRTKDARLNRVVALKIIPKEKFNKEQLEEILQRFEQEAKALAKLSHPNIVPILDYGEHDGSPYLVLEYLSGGTLRKRMEPLLPWQVAVNVMLPIMEALTYCHEHSILHRDIKPSNILFREDDTPVLTDFGIAKLLESVGTPLKTGTGVFVGTPGYMAPEQHNNSDNKKLDARTDVYQMGIVLYEAITGYRPSDLANIVETIPHPKSRAPNLPVVFDKIILKALAFNPKDRYQSMEEFRAALKNALNEHPFSSETQAYLPPGQISKPPKRSDVKSHPLPVFLSYTQLDEANVSSLGHALRVDGMRIRPDKKSSNPGVNWQEKLFKDVQKSEAVILCLTKNSAVKNGNLQPEIKLAMEIAQAKSIPIIPVRLHNCKILQELSKIEHVDLFEPGGYLKLHSQLAARAKQVDATPPLTGAFYLPPAIAGEDPSSVKYAPLAALFFIVVIAVLFQFRQILLPAQDIIPTSTIAATGTYTPTPVKQDFTEYPTDIIDETGTKMRLVKSGEFSMGYEAEEALLECRKYGFNCLLNQYVGAEPAGPIYLAAYYIDHYEVTNKAYQECVQANICQPPKKTSSNTRTNYFGTKEFSLFPVVYVDWGMAKTYCEEWRGARLPTEAEWEKAARGTEGYLFPWGNELDDMLVNFCDKNCPLSSADRNSMDLYPDTAPVFVLSGGASPYGVYNMAGNVWEWISSLYKPYPYNPSDGRENLQQGMDDVRVVRGGSWRDDVGNIFSITRNGYDPTTANDSIGFRCAKTP